MAIGNRKPLCGVEQKGKRALHCTDSLIDHFYQSPLWRLLKLKPLSKSNRALRETKTAFLLTIGNYSTTDGIANNPNRWWGDEPSCKYTKGKMQISWSWWGDEPSGKCTKRELITSILEWKISHTELLIQENIAHTGGKDNGWIEKNDSVLHWEGH